ncbi:hypothetical protein TNCV_1800681 [Trichonephila clavipes]|nr:hypothetical protein TNCV_1800681 [Trichonephila clavipes]
MDFYARNLRSKIQSLRKYSRGRGKLSLEGAKPAIGFENYIRFIYVRRCRAERRKEFLNALQKVCLSIEGDSSITSSKSFKRPAFMLASLLGAGRKRTTLFQLHE